MSLRQQAKILGTSHANLSRMINGKRKWNPQLKARYDELVGTTLVPVGAGSGTSQYLQVSQFMPVRNGEPGGTRTHDTRIKSPML